MIIPMFPLGSAVVPLQQVPLHVFEPRYRALVRDCLDGDGTFESMVGDTVPAGVLLRARVEGAPGAELQIVRHALGDVPLVGFFAAGEIARHHLYGYTGVLTVFR